MTVITGGVMSIFCVSVPVPVLPALSVQVAVTATAVPCSLAGLVVVAGHLAATRALLSTQYQLTVTGERYQPLLPAAPPVIVGVADGVVTSMTLRQPSA